METIKKMMIKGVGYSLIGGSILVLMLMLVCNYCTPTAGKPMNLCHQSEFWWNGHFWFADRSGSEYGYIFNKLTGDIVLDPVADIKCPTKGQKLAYYSNGEKYGYVDLQTFEVVIPPVYSTASDFCEGIAAVSINDTLLFIKEDGQRYITESYRLVDRVDDCNLWRGFCKVGTFDNKQGVIDKSGNWLLEPIYDVLCEETDGYWSMVVNEKWGVIAPNYQILFPCQYNMAQVVSGKGIILAMENHTLNRFDFNGSLLDRNVFSEVMDMTYNSDTYDKKGDRIEKVALCRKYMAEDGYWGLMNRYGEVISLPLYENINALDNNTYLCSFTEDKHILLNSKGQMINP